MYCLMLQMSCLFFYELYLVFTCGPRQQHPAGGGAGAGAGAGGEAGAGAGAGAARRPARADYLNQSSFHQSSHQSSMFGKVPD